MGHRLEQLKEVGSFFKDLGSFVGYCLLYVGAVAALTAVIAFPIFYLMGVFD